MAEPEHLEFPEPLSSHEYSAFLTGLVNYLENPSELGRLEQSLEIINEQLNSNSSENYYCYHCGADFSDWYSLSDEEREHQIESDPDINPRNLPICCPCCGIPYEDEDDEIY
ncbi:hypothetical protein [Nostoc sp.]|uniref:hypothetical protein n=1 Tax=Nostoc sp. TaxID=1180 RepID=UPI002FF73A13